MHASTVSEVRQHISDPEPDFADYPGPPLARLAAEVFAAGGHSLLIVSRCSADSLMLAEHIRGLLPELSKRDAFEATAVHLAPSQSPWGHAQLVRPPFVRTHSKCSVRAMMGGGPLAEPGAASLAHRGMLVMEDAPKFSPDVLQALGHALEVGQVALDGPDARTFKYPVRPQLILTAAPCPCGAIRDGSCNCTPGERRRYLRRLAGPILDRVEMRINLDSTDPVSIRQHLRPWETSETIVRRVTAVRERSARRMSDTLWRLNAEFRSTPRYPFELARGALGELEHEVLSSRERGNVLRVALTLADLAERDRPGRDEVRTALQLFLGGKAH